MTVSAAKHQLTDTSRMTVISPPGAGEIVHLPAGINALAAQFVRHGDDLDLQLPNGQHITLPGFFSHGSHDLVMDGGQVISAHAVQALAGPLAPAQVAQNAADAGGHDGLIQVGLVDKILGTATVKHADGTSEPLTQGSIVYQNDVVESGGNSSVGLILADSSTFSLGASGRMVLDEVLYDPESKGGHAAVEILTGGFGLVSGQIAKAGPNAMSVKTPVMTIAVRGTTVAGQVNDSGETAVALVADPTGNIGQVTISNQSGIQVLTQPNTLISLSSATQAPPAPIVVPPSYVQQTFGQSLNSLPVPPAAGTMEWSTKPGAHQAPPVQQIQNREGANKVVDPTSSTGTKEAPHQDSSKTESKAAQPEHQAATAEATATAATADHAAATTATATDHNAANTPEAAAAAAVAEAAAHVTGGTASLGTINFLSASPFESSNLDFSSNLLSSASGLNAFSSNTALSSGSSDALANSLQQAITEALNKAIEAALSSQNNDSNLDSLLQQLLGNDADIASLLKDYVPSEASGQGTVTYSSAIPFSMHDGSGSGISFSVSGASGEDTFILSTPTTMTMNNHATLYGNGGTDMLDLSIISESSLRYLDGFYRSGDDFVIKFKTEAGGGSITLANEFTGSGIEYIVTPSENLIQIAHHGSGAIIDGSGISLDQIIVGSSTSSETLIGGSGDDDFYVGSGTISITGHAGDNTVHFEGNTAATMSSDLSVSGDGTISYGGHNIAVTSIGCIVGGDGADTLHGWSNTSSWFELEGGKGSDTLIGNSGHHISANYSHDIGLIHASLTLSSGFASGDVTQYAGDGTTALYTDHLEEITDLDGSYLNDSVTLSGSGGGNFYYDPVGGRDTISFTGDASTSASVGFGHATSGVTVSLAESGEQHYYSASDNNNTVTLTGITGINGSDYNDTLTGSTTDDWLAGGRGNDTLTGGDGADSFQFGGSSDATLISQLGTDTITDFSHLNGDTMVLSDRVFHLGTTGCLSTTSGSATMATTATAMTATAQSCDSGTQAGIILVGASTGSAGVEVWYTSHMNNASTANSYQIAVLSNQNTAHVHATDITLMS